MTRKHNEQPFRLPSTVQDPTEHERILIGYWRDVTAGTDPVPDLALVQVLHRWWMKA